MLIAGIVLLLTYLLIIVEKIPKVAVVLFMASVVLVLGIVPANKAFGYIDFSVIFLLVSMMVIAFVTEKSGIFTWVAIEILKLSKGNPKLILIYMATFTALLSAFLNNATVVILLLPVTFEVAKQLEISPQPFLITEIIASNIGGTATLIGDPPNLIIGSAAGFTFTDFLRELTPVILIIFVVCTAILAFMFRKVLVTSPELQEKAQKIDNSSSIQDKRLMILSLIVLAMVISGFVFYDFLHIEAYIVALFGASILLLFQSQKCVFEDIEWNTIVFFIGLFIIIGGLIETGGINYLANYILHITNGNTSFTSMLILWGSGILSGFIDNIPYTVTMVPLIQNLHNCMNTNPLWWSLALGACLGGNITIIGSAANIIVAEAAYREGYPISFLKFFKYGALTSFVALLISSVYIYFRYLT
jgi:Na+/H+ antiporter NhaD/arsenite permease-like protein